MYVIMNSGLAYNPLLLQSIFIKYCSAVLQSAALEAHEFTLIDLVFSF